MSQFVESEPCKQQAKLMKRLGFRLQDTDDSLTAVWQQGPCLLHLPAAWVPDDEAAVAQKLIAHCYADGMAAARQQMRAALGIS